MLQSNLKPQSQINFHNLTNEGFISKMLVEFRWNPGSVQSISIVQNE